MSSGHSIFIPVANRAEEVQVQVDNLPAVTDVLDLLKAEEAPLHIWLDLAREYFKQGKDDAFLEILREGSGPEVEEVYGDVKYERIAILNALGAYYSNLGRMSLNKRHKDDHFIAAVDYYNKAARIDPQEVTTWVGKGQLQVAKGEWDQAAEMFKCALETQADHVAALLGEACCLFHKGKVEEALKTYKKVLQLHPNCPPPVRLGIGLCHYRLAETTPTLAPLHAAKARQAFERVLELDPDNVEAMVALGVMDVNAGGEALEGGLSRLRLAYNTYPYNAMCLNQLGHHLFYSGQQPHLLQPLQEAALACTDHPQMRCESHYSVARSYHWGEEYDKAASYYRAAIKEGGGQPHAFLPPLYHYAQLLMRRGDRTEALKLLQTVMDASPTNVDALKAAASVHADCGRSTEAANCLKKVTESAPGDLAAHLQSADLLAHCDLEEALKALQRARKIVEGEGGALPLPLLNNLAVVHMERGEGAEAAEVMREAMEVAHSTQSESERGSDSIPVSFLSLYYNQARVWEGEQQSSAAAGIYDRIRKQYPFYTDATLRLAAMAQSRGQWEESQSVLKEAIVAAGETVQVDALLLLSTAQMACGEWMEAKASIRSTLPSPVGYVALGNWNLAMSSRPSKDPKAEATHLEKAGDNYLKALTTHPSNLYAAHGIGCALAAKGQTDSARDIFTAVQEAAAANPTHPLPHVWPNQAHLQLLRGQPCVARKLYEKCVGRNRVGEDVLHSYAAKCCYEGEEMRGCIKHLLMARRLAPTHHPLTFNLAACFQKVASTKLQSKGGGGGGGTQAGRGGGCEAGGRAGSRDLQAAGGVGLGCPQVPPAHRLLRDHAGAFEDQHGGCRERGEGRGFEAGSEEGGGGQLSREERGGGEACGGGGGGVARRGGAAGGGYEGEA